MARTLRDAKFDTRAARLRLKIRREPYWRTISEGLAIGYRKGAKGGTWIARHYNAEHGRQYHALGTTDDVADADGTQVLTFAEAQEAARHWFGELARQHSGELHSGPYTIRDAMADYLADYMRRGGKATYRLETVINAHITPILGDVLVTKLTRSRVEGWLDGLATKRPRARTRKGQPQRYRAMPKDDEALRRRRSTANRVFTVLKAALNLAYQRGRAPAPDAWVTVKPFREADASRLRYLSDDEARRLVNASPPDLRAIATAALLTGARYGELAALRAHDFNPESGTLHIVRSKSGSPRHVALTDEGRQFFARAIAGKTGNDLLFSRATGAPWKQADQFRPLTAACRAATITPAIGFHVLRHTYASRLAMKGVPMAVIAAQLGHADLRVTTRHYAHLSPSFISDTVRAAFGNLGLVEQDNVAAISTGR